MGAFFAPYLIGLPTFSRTPCWCMTIQIRDDEEFQLNPGMSLKSYRIPRGRWVLCYMPSTENLFLRPYMGPWEYSGPPLPCRPCPPCPPPPSGYGRRLKRRRGRKSVIYPIGVYGSYLGVTGRDPQTPSGMSGGALLTSHIGPGRSCYPCHGHLLHWRSGRRKTSWLMSLNPGHPPPWSPSSDGPVRPPSEQGCLRPRRFRSRGSSSAVSGIRTYAFCHVHCPLIS